MEFKEIKQKIINLKHLASKIHYSKILTLQKIKSKRKVFENIFSQALLTKQIFNYLEKKFKIKTKFYSYSKNSESDKKILWIYFSAEKELLSLNNDVLEEILVNKMSLNDFVIPVGLEACKFIERENLNSPVQFANKNKSLVNLQKSVAHFFQNNLVNEVKVLIHSSKINDNGITILPLKDLKLRNNIHDYQIDLKKKYFFYPHLQSVLEQLFYNYMQNIISGFVRESDIYLLKQKLLRHKKSEDEINKKIIFLKKQFNKKKAEIITNEMILLANIKKQIKKEILFIKQEENYHE